MKHIKFNIAHIKLKTNAEGPYDRCCIWFQGCNINCKGCCNQDLQPFIVQHIATLEQLLDIVKEAKNKFNIEGITLSGGEPSLQKDLYIFNNKIHEMGLGIIMFSGKTRNELPQELVNSVDLLIDGPFINTQIDNKRILIGSKNKRVIPITSRYKKQLEYFNNNKSIEEITVEDYIFVNGD
mgnify:CR=1 FL=1